jgi:hypothetical protein
MLLSSKLGMTTIAQDFWIHHMFDVGTINGIVASPGSSLQCYFDSERGSELSTSLTSLRTHKKVLNLQEMQVCSTFGNMSSAGQQHIPCDAHSQFPSRPAQHAHQPKL